VLTPELSKKRADPDSDQEYILSNKKKNVEPKASNTIERRRRI
jgi:hypothetical protein